MLCCMWRFVACRAVCRAVPCAVPCRGKNSCGVLCRLGGVNFWRPLFYIGSKYVRKGTIPYGTLPYIPYIGTYVPTSTVRTHMIPAWVRTKFGDLPGGPLFFMFSLEYFPAFFCMTRAITSSMS